VRPRFVLFYRLISNDWLFLSLDAGNPLALAAHAQSSVTINPIQPFLVQRPTFGQHQYVQSAIDITALLLGQRC
jgi:hypothetical protein